MKVADIRNILSSVTRRAPESLEIESLGKSFLFRRLTGLEADTMQVALMTDDGKVDVKKLRGHRAKLVAACLVDEDGAAVFTPTEVAEWDNDLLNDFHNVCRKLNKMGKEEVEAEVKP